MAPPTKAVRMERELDAAAKTVDEWHRLEYLTRVARVRADIRLRRARRSGASLRTIEGATGVPRATVDRICKGPEPELPVKENTA